MTMASLPKECRAVLNAPSPVSEVAVTVGPDDDAMAVARAEAAARPRPNRRRTFAVAPERQCRIRRFADAAADQRLHRDAGDRRSIAAPAARASRTLRFQSRSGLRETSSLSGECILPSVQSDNARHRVALSPVGGFARE